MKRFMFILVSCIVTFSVSYGQITESVSKAFELKVANKQELLDKLNRENLARELLWNQELEKVRNSLPEIRKVSDNTRIEVKPTVLMQTAEDGSEEMNLQLSFSYSTSISEYGIKTSVSSNTDDYPPGAYNAMSSNACMLTCNFIRKKIETELSKYFIPGGKVTVRITGETDGSDIASRIAYKGEYGDFFNKMIYLNGAISNMTVNQQSGITSNSQLAFLRTQGVEEFLNTYVDELHRTRNVYQIYAVENKEKGNQYRRISIDLTIHGAFNKEMGELADTPKALPQTDVASDVNTGIPVRKVDNTDCFVLIIANENYNSPLSSVPFAHNDGVIFKEYCLKTLAVPERQVKMIIDATLNGMQNGIDWLMGMMNSWAGNAKVLVYYAGHGVPDMQTNSAYLVPVDANPIKVNQLYSLGKLYNMLGDISCKSTTIFLDACFSGTRRNGEMLVEGTRGVVIQAKQELLKGNTIVFSAAEAHQTAHPLKEQKHGLFTYYLLKSLKESQGKITYGELFEQIKKNVDREARLNSKEQTPTVSTSDKLINTWKDLKL